MALSIGVDERGRSSVLSVQPFVPEEYTSFHSRERRLFELQALETGLRHALRQYAPPYQRTESLPMLERETRYSLLFSRHAKMLQEHARMLRSEMLSAQRLLVTATNSQKNKQATKRFVSNVFADLHSISSLIETLVIRARMLQQAERIRANPDAREESHFSSLLSSSSSSSSSVQYQRAQRNALLESRTLRTVAHDAEYFDAKKTSKQRLVEEEMRAMDTASTSSRHSASSRSRTLSQSRGPFGLAVDPSIELRPMMLGVETPQKVRPKTSNVFDRNLPSILLSDLELPFEKNLEKMGEDRTKQKMPRLHTNGKQLVERDQWVSRV